MLSRRISVWLLVVVVVALVWVGITSLHRAKRHADKPITDLGVDHAAQRTGRRPGFR